MLVGIVQRMILRDLARVFGACLVAVTGLLLVAGALTEGVGRGMSPRQVLVLVPLLIPRTLPYTIPAAVLFATTAVYGRLAQHQELLALKASGVRTGALARPAILLGIVTSATTLALYHTVIPVAQRVWCAVSLKDPAALLYGRLRDKGTISFPALDYVLFVRDVRGRQLVSPVFKKRGPGGSYNEVVYSGDGDLRVDEAQHRMLLHLRKADFFSRGAVRGRFEERLWDLPLPADFGAVNGYRLACGLTGRELLRRHREAVAEQQSLESQLGAAANRGGGAVDTSSSAAARGRWKQLRREAFMLITEFHVRQALSVSCLCFVLVGCPLGIRFGHGSYLGAFALCFLPIGLLYYPLMFCGVKLACSGQLPAVVALWGANVATAVVGALLFRGPGTR